MEQASVQHETATNGAEMPTEQEFIDNVIAQSMGIANRILYAAEELVRNPPQPKQPPVITEVIEADNE